MIKNNIKNSEGTELTTDLKQLIVAPKGTEYIGTPST